MKYVILFSVLMLSIVLVTNYDSAFATHMGSHHDDDQMGQYGMKDNMMRNHHMSYKGMCGPGFASLDGMCVLDDRCGAGAYAGKVCIMDGVMKQYLRPLHQKHAGISVDNIICAEGKHLMFKHHDSTPACIDSDSVEKLKHRGWQTEKPLMACTLEYDPICGVDGMTYGNMCGLKTQHMAMKHNGECTISTSSYMNKVIPTLDDFKNTLSESYDIDTIFFKFGNPHDDIGSGIHIYVYELNDSTEIWIGYIDHILYIKHVDSNGIILEELFVEN